MQKFIPKVFYLKSHEELVKNIHSVLEKIKQKEDTALKHLNGSPIWSKSTVYHWINGSENQCLDSLITVLVNSNVVRLALNTQKKSSLFYRICEMFDAAQSTGLSLQERKQYLDISRNFAINAFKEQNYLTSSNQKNCVNLLQEFFKIDSVVDECFKNTVRFSMECDVCNLKKVSTKDTNGCILFPKTLNFFHPLNAQHLVSCLNCKSDNQTQTISFKFMASCISMGFPNGIHHCNFHILDFVVKTFAYSVYAIIQLNKDNHLVTWIRNTQSNKWFKMDKDMELGNCCLVKKPNIPPRSIYMIFWEKQTADVMLKDKKNSEEFFQRIDCCDMIDEEEDTSTEDTDENRSFVDATDSPKVDQPGGSKSDDQVNEEDQKNDNEDVHFIEPSVVETPQDDFCNHLISLKRKSSESCLDENMLKSISAEQQSTDSISLSNNQKEKDSTQPKKLKKNSPKTKQTSNTSQPNIKKVDTSPYCHTKKVSKKTNFDNPDVLLDLLASSLQPKSK